MSATFLDANIIIDDLRGVPEADSELRRYDEFLTSRIAWIEVLAGAKVTEKQVVESFLQTFNVLELTPTVASRAVSIRRQYRLKLPDAIIYATALVHGLTLVTRNTRNFHKGMPGIRIPYRL